METTTVRGELSRLPVLSILCALLLAGCDGNPWNSPYRAGERLDNTVYSVFSARPKHLDPVISYSSNEYDFIAQIYEPPLQYHFFKRPFELEALTAVDIPKVVYTDKNGKNLPADHPSPAYSIYDVRIKPGIRYQPHPAFAKHNGEYRYWNLNAAQMDAINTIGDFAHTNSRELVAADYIYQVKRMALPKNHCPIFPLLADYIVGLKDFRGRISKAYDDLVKRQGKNAFLDLRRYELEGVKEVDRYTLRIKIRGKYPQILYWMAMPFFAPMPHEVEQFYSQAVLQDKNINLDWYPVGSGPYMLTENNPNRRMVLTRNPNFRGEKYPGGGSDADRRKGLMDDTGKPMPFVDRYVFMLEKESIPYWNKFLQGYYDQAGVSNASFDQVVQIASSGEISLTQEMRDKGIKLETTVLASTYYLGFNMKDKVVGGSSERARKLRQAISISVDYEEYISVFQNGRGIPAQSPLPPGIFGFQKGEKGLNRVVYDWVDGKARRKSIEAAKKLLAEAGYKDGIDRESGVPLVLHFDGTATSPEDKARQNWLRKQLQKIDIQLEFRNTDYNRFRDKMINGSSQLFLWGWNADYPDPENFLFLLYGPNGKVDYRGENASNYKNPEFDRLFDQMKSMNNSPERLRIVEKMITIVQRDAPWLFGFHPKSFSLYHSWVKNHKPHVIANNTLKYKRIDPVLRDRQRLTWNRPVLWPVYLVLAVLFVIALPGVYSYWRREYGGG